MLAALLASPIDGLLFPSPAPSYDDAVFPWAAADCLWLRDEAAGTRFPVVVLQPEDGTPPVRVILYCHGNACDIGEVHSTLKHEAARWRALVVLVEYPGYGTSQGRASADGIDRHVRAAFQHFHETLGVPASRFVLFGCSVGTGPAAALASRVPGIGALILQSPYKSIRDAAAHIAGGLAYLIWERWDNAAALSALACPVLVIHGTEDEVIPFSHGQELVRQRTQAGLPVTLHAQAGGSHNQFRGKEDLSEPVAAFLQREHPQGSALVTRTAGGVRSWGQVK